MSTLREAAQQALEALEKSRVFVTTREKIKHPEGTEWYDGTIAALRDALAQQEEGRMEFNVKETVCAKCGSTNGAHSHDCPVAKAALKERNT
jgi:protein-disulfide isomerase